MKTKSFALLAMGLCLLAGCATQNINAVDKASLAQLVGKRVTLTGMAYHSCPGAVVFDTNCIVLVDTLKYWPADYDHKPVQVTGRLRAIHAPDLYKIEKAQWTLAP